MVNAARKYGRVTQVGTQQRSMPINNWASDLVKNGAIGKIKTVLAPNFVGPVRWTGEAARADATGRQPRLVGCLDQPGRAAALSPRTAPRLGQMVGLRRRRTLLRRDRLGHPLPTTRSNGRWAPTRRARSKWSWKKPSGISRAASSKR